MLENVIEQLQRQGGERLLATDDFVENVISCWIMGQNAVDWKMRLSTRTLRIFRPWWRMVIKDSNNAVMVISFHPSFCTPSCISLAAFYRGETRFKLTIVIFGNITLSSSLHAVLTSGIRWRGSSRGPGAFGSSKLNPQLQRTRLKEGLICPRIMP